MIPTIKHSLSEDDDDNLFIGSASPLVHVMGRHAGG